MQAVTILSYSIENKIEPQLSWLQSRFGLDDEGLRSMLCTSPTLLNVNMKNIIEPKLDFYADILGEDESIRLIAKDPRFLTYSLEKRLKPRLAEASALGIIMDSCFLNYLAKLTDEKWGNKIEKYKLKQMKESIGGFS